MSAFDTIFDRVLSSEGGYQEDSDDRGNWTTGVVGEGELKGTKYGISAMTYPHVDIKNLTIEQAKSIYRRDWWQKYQLFILEPAVGYQLVDAMIHHGPSRAVKFLQQVVGVTVDGILGPITREAAQYYKPELLIMSFLALRLEFMAKTPTWAKYSRGFIKRIVNNFEYAARDLKP